jgi:hypothetical protein
MRTKFSSEDLEGREHLEDPGIDVKISEVVEGKWGGKRWIGCIWFRIGISVGLL